MCANHDAEHGVTNFGIKKEIYHMKVVSIIDFGAEPNMKEIQTRKIQSAIDYVFSNGGGKVQIPTGEYYITSLRLRSGVCLHLLEDAVLIASRNPGDYFILKNDVIEPVYESNLDEGEAWNNVWVQRDKISVGFHTLGSRWHNGIIRALNAEDISIIGEKGSAIDGCNCFDEKGEEHYRGPHGTSIISCNNVILRGYTVRHSGNWANMLQNCSNILIEDVTVEAGHDGVHLTSCDNVKIKNCHFYTGDDCVAGYDINNMVVEKCELNSACSAFRLGGTNILIENCHAYAPARHLFRGGMTDEEKRAGILSNDAASKETGYNMGGNMLSFFTYYADCATVIRNLPENIIVKDCVVDMADRFLHFNYSGNEIWQNNRPLAQITFENIKATGISMPLTAYGDKKEPCSLTLKNIDYSLREGFETTTFMHAANLSHLCMKKIKIRNASGGQLVKLWGDVLPKAQMEDVSGNVASDYIVRTNEEFICNPI